MSHSYLAYPGPIRPNTAFTCLGSHTQRGVVIVARVALCPQQFMSFHERISQAQYTISDVELFGMPGAI